MKTVIITGVTGQMGSYLAELLLSKGLRVIGAVRRLSVPNNSNIKQIKNSNFILEIMDLGDMHSVTSIIQKYQPEYFLNCAANSFVGTSWDCPEQHLQYNTLGVLRELEAIRKFSPKTRYLNFGSSEEFGDVVQVPQTETHPPRARSPYGASKVAARQVVKVWRESYNLYALQCWCFNYESPRRGEEFITRKITKGIARILSSIKNNESFKPIELGNIYARRDWSHASDFANGIWMMMNQEEYRIDLFAASDLRTFPSQLPKNIKEYVFSSGEARSVKDFLNRCFELTNIDGQWIGTGMDEQYIWNNNIIVKINPDFYRPAEVNLLLGSSELAKKELGWEPKISFEELIKSMLERDLSDYNISLDSLNQ